MFAPIFPVTIPALAPLNRYAPLVWLAGVLCLWLTRYTHQLGKRWGRRYYLLSAGLRPLGVVLIALGWLALYSPGRHPYPPFGLRALWLPHGNATDVLCWLAVLGFFALGIWAVATLGLRQSFLYRHLDDRLITRGPYALVRHPQFLAAIGMSLFSALLFDPGAVVPFFLDPFGYFHSPLVNSVLLALAFWTLSILEDWELASHFGAEYEVYAARVPRLFPN